MDHPVNAVECGEPGRNGVLEVRGLTKYYSGIPAIEDVSFTAPAGEVTGYLGPNGSGKSTTVKIITGLLTPSTGEVLYKGVPIQRDAIAYKQRLGYVPEEPYLYTHVTGSEYLELAGELRGLPASNLKPKIRELLKLHTDDAKCARCHVRFDDVGLSMEGFDPIGRTRSSFAR